MMVPLHQHPLRFRTQAGYQFDELWDILLRAKLLQSTSGFSE